MGVTRIARCPEHGLHGERDSCFVCDGPVEQVEMVEASVLRELVEAYDSCFDADAKDSHNRLADALDAAKELLS